jgi:NitT/TauT family transport system ATP-binding protein
VREALAPVPSAVRAAAAVDAEGLTRCFGSGPDQLRAVGPVTFTVPAGEFVGIVGPSGCGKSTLLHLLSGLLRPSGGQVRIFGQPVQGVRPHQVGYVFQRDALLPWKTVLDNVMLPLLLRGHGASDARLRALEWVHKVGLAGVERRYPSQLSGGMRKRVALAMTMVYRPPLILMDEPFAALDVQTRNRMENELLSLWAETGGTVLFVTHDLEEAIALADRIIVMTAAPGRVKAVYPVPLPRPRDVAEIRTRGEFTALYRQMWEDLRDEVDATPPRA